MIGPHFRGSGCSALRTYFKEGYTSDSVFAYDGCMISTCICGDGCMISTCICGDGA